MSQQMPALLTEGWVNLPALTLDLEVQEPHIYVGELTGRFDTDNGRHVVYCNELPVGGIGKTRDDAWDNFVGCLRTYLELSIAKGVMAEVMADCGFDSHQGSLSVDEDDFAMKIPIAAGSNGQRSAL